MRNRYIASAFAKSTKLQVCKIGFTCALAFLLPMQSAFATTRALLIGVSGYPNLPVKKQLLGPKNDVQLLRAALIHSGLSPAQITVIADGVAGSVALPTRNQILTQLRLLADRSQEGDWAIIYFSGHGSQQPQALTSSTSYIEPDGLEEIFLPYDVAKWDEKQQKVEGALIDDEIGAVLEYFDKRNVKVWAIFDTCHAGGMLKSLVDKPDGAVSRFVNPVELGVPAILMKTAVEVAAKKGSASKTWDGDSRARNRHLLQNKSSDRQFVFYASQADEPSAEEPLPPPALWPHAKSSERMYFGLFTYLIANELPGWSGKFSEIASRVRSGYHARPYPTPSFDGNLAVQPNFLK